MGRLGVILSGEVRVYVMLVTRNLAVKLLALGKRVTEDETMIRGGLKYTWSTGTSTSGIVRPKSPSTSA